MALPNTNITVGKPPLLWHNVQDALVKINENFDSVAAALGVAGLTPIDFETLDTNVSPTADNTYSLGAISTNRWKALYTAEYAATVSDANNGIHLGAAHIKGISGTIDLPYGSTVSGNLIIDPDKTFFKSVQVDNGEQVVAGDFSDTLNLLSGNGISMNVDSSAESITIDNTGILDITAGSGISRTIVSGTATITNAGVRSLQSVTALPSGRTLGAGINIDNATGDNVKVTNTGVLEIQAGSAALTISTDAATGIVTITNAAPAGNAFRNVIVNSDSPNPIEANSVAGVLNLNQGAGITLTKNVITDTITFAVDPVFDLKGSVFGDDSSILVDAVSNYIYGNVSATTLRTAEFEIALGQGAGGDGLQGSESIAIGMSAGAFTQGDYAVAIGSGAGNIGQGNRAVAIGATAGVDQGDYAISIGNGAGYPSAVAQSIAINASGFPLDAPAAGFYVNPVRSTATATGPAMYNPTTKELFYNTVLEFAGSTISTNDSSGITIDVQTTFNTDVTFENDITIAERLTLKGSRVINLSELKSLAAASTSFADFQSKISTMV